MDVALDYVGLCPRLHIGPVLDVGEVLEEEYALALGLADWLHNPNRPPRLSPGLPELLLKERVLRGQVMS